MLDIRKLVGAVFAAALLATLPAAAHAQEAPRADVYTGYSRIQTASGGVNGFNASLAGHITDSFALVVDGAAYQGEFGTVMGGPRFTYRAGRVEPFAQALFGGVIGSDEREFSMAIGGGVDVKLSDRFAIRVVQADYFRAAGANFARIGAGVVFRFGGH
jgi:opacity protein-like surface antigen